jgi:hypothetical protein
VRWSALLLALAALLGVGGSASAASNAKPRVTVIGDSVAESFDYVASARRYLGRGLDVRSDTAVCRRLVAASCMFQGAQPKTALEVVAAGSGSLGSVVIVNVGYNDWAAVYDVDRVMRALDRAGVRSAIWVTLRATTANYARNNARILEAKPRWQRLVIADWNAYSRGKPGSARTVFI